VINRVPCETHELIRADGGMHYTGPTLTPTLSHPMGEGVPREALTPTLSHPMGEGAASGRRSSRMLCVGAAERCSHGLQPLGA
jgi:hypothetical protein